MAKNVTIQNGGGGEYDVLPDVAAEFLKQGIAHPCPGTTADGRPGLWHLSIGATWDDVERVEAGV
jgi:hypothetical protein